MFKRVSLVYISDMEISPKAQLKKKTEKKIIKNKLRCSKVNMDPMSVFAKDRHLLWCAI